MEEHGPVPHSVLIAGGGTGGHVIPGLAVARALQELGVEHIAFLGTQRGLESKLVPAAGFPLHLIRISGLKNLGLRAKLRTSVALPGAVVQSRRVLKQCAAEVVLGIGGYVSGPALIAACWQTPVVVLETNAKTGLANRLARSWVRVAAVNFPETAKDFRHAVITGVPVREEFFDIPAARHEGLPTILAFGGSQGARILNDTLPEVARLLQHQEWHFRLIHQTGSSDVEAVRERYRAYGVEQVEVTAFLDDMPAAMAAADLVVCRSGASTLGELAAAGRAALLIPLPGAADQHQLRNARAYEAAGAAAVLEQTAVTPLRLAEVLQNLLREPHKLRAMEAAVRLFGRPKAAHTIARLVIAASHLHRHERFH
ncbi:MAG: undecaprenyldiphospho-muramoylpentapeptide beta-N-acetylglucosaminyltransferase [Terriglobales bacterium]